METRVMIFSGNLKFDEGGSHTESGRRNWVRWRINLAGKQSQT
jgi:hypothetical protein